jgi:DNA replication protein DnaC
MAFIEFDKVSKIYRSGQVEIAALREASFEIEQGELCVIVGQSGAGKTHICSAIAREFIKQGKATRYVMWVQMIERLKDYKDDTRASYADDLYNVDVLYIDDYFKPDGTAAKFTRQDIIKTFEVIDKRYKQPDKVTIISSELTIYDISAIDEATAGRIREMAKSYVLDIPKDKAKNYRMR